jgi:hypothetical protein
MVSETTADTCVSAPSVWMPLYSININEPTSPRRIHISCLLYYSAIIPTMYIHVETFKDLLRISPAPINLPISNMLAMTTGTTVPVMIICPWTKSNVNFTRSVVPTNETLDRKLLRYWQEEEKLMYTWASYNPLPGSRASSTFLETSRDTNP